MNPYEPAGRRRGLARAHRILRMLHDRGYITDTELAQALESDLGLIPRQTRAPDALHAVLALQDKARQHGNHAPGDARPRYPARRCHDPEAQPRADCRQRCDQHRGDGRRSADGRGARARRFERLLRRGRSRCDGLRPGEAVAGSALKPFIYALALESGKWTAGSEIADTRADYSADEEGGA